MIAHSVILKEQPDKESFMQFVKEMGGYWATSPTVVGYEYGVIEKCGAAVLIDLGEINEFAVDYEEFQIDQLKRYLGTEPRKVINLHIRRNRRSIALALKIEEKIVAKWGGYIDKE